MTIVVKWVHLSKGTTFPEHKLTMGVHRCAEMQADCQGCREVRWGRTKGI